MDFQCDDDDDDYDYDDDDVAAAAAVAADHDGDVRVVVRVLTTIAIYISIVTPCRALVMNFLSIVYLIPIFLNEKDMYKHQQHIEYVVCIYYFWNNGTSWSLAAVGGMGLFPDT